MSQELRGWRSVRQDFGHDTGDVVGSAVCERECDEVTGRFVRVSFGSQHPGDYVVIGDLVEAVVIYPLTWQQRWQQLADEGPLRLVRDNRYFGRFRR